MLKKIAKWIAIALGAALGVALLAYLVLYLVSVRHQHREYAIAPEQLVLHANPDRARGEHLVQVACTGCHGPDLGGQMMGSNFLFGTLWSKNLTRGEGGVGRAFRTGDFVRAIRFGVHTDGRSVLFMPTNAFEHFSDSDLASMIGYLDSVPPVDRPIPAARIGPLLRVLSVLTPIPLFSAEHVEADATHTMPPPSDTVGYGGYLAAAGGCTECHGPTLGGGSQAPNITRGGPLASWTETDFRRAIHEGKRPDGTPISEAMPWKEYSRLTDAEQHAIWMYIRSVPPVAPKPK